MILAQMVLIRASKVVCCSAVTASICEFAVSFGQFLQKNAVHSSVSVFTVPDFNHVQSKH